MKLQRERHLLCSPHIARISIYCDGGADRLSSPFLSLILWNIEEAKMDLDETAEA